MAVAAVVVFGASAALAVVRPLFRAIGVTGDPVVPGRIAAPTSVAAICLGLAALYLTSTRTLRGRGLSRLAIGGGAVVGIFAFFYAAVADGTLEPGRFAQYFDWEILKTLPGDFQRGVVNTLKLAFVAQILAMVVGMAFATFVLSPKPWFHYPAVAYVDVVRGLPLVVLIYLINYGLPNVGITLGAFASPVIILTINASAYVAEIFRAGIQSLPRGQMDAARSLGMPHGTAMLFVVIPQALRAVIPPLVSEFIALVKDTAIVMALIGFTTASRDLFGAASHISASTFSPTPVMAAGLVYLAITVPLARLVGTLERRVRAKVA